MIIENLTNPEKDIFSLYFPIRQQVIDQILPLLQDDPNIVLGVAEGRYLLEKYHKLGDKYIFLPKRTLRDIKGNEAVFEELFTGYMYSHCLVREQAERNQIVLPVVSEVDVLSHYTKTQVEQGNLSVEEVVGLYRQKLSDERCFIKSLDKVASHPLIHDPAVFYLGAFDGYDCLKKTITSFLNDANLRVI